MPQLNFEEFVPQIEDLIRAGRFEEARAALSALKGQVIPRARASTLATLARRAQDLNLAMQIMMPILRPKVALEKEVTDSEKAAYAVILLGVGASSEALTTLESGNPEDAEINLALAFAHINRWDYHAAIGYLTKYLQIGGMVPYQRMIAEVNLAASYVSIGDSINGRKLLERILQETRDNHWQLLHRNCLELDAQLAIREGDWERASRRLQAAGEEEAKGSKFDGLFVKKWNAILAVSRDGANQDTLSALMEVRSGAIKNRHWETIRDCDYHRAVALRDRALFEHVYFGTPYRSYRERILPGVKGWFEIPESYVWQLHEERSSRVFEVETGSELNGGPANLKPGKSLHAAVLTLASDFYRPFVLGSLHSQVFPNEYFNPSTSPRRVAFLLHRLREWLKENEIPIQIEAGKDGYRFVAEGPFAFKVSREKIAREEDDPGHFPVFLDRLRVHFGTTLFSAAQAAEHLQISLRLARYLVKWALGKNHLERLGSGRSTLYRTRQ